MRARTRRYAVAALLAAAPLFLLPPSGRAAGITSLAVEISRADLLAERLGAPALIRVYAAAFGPVLGERAGPLIAAMYRGEAFRMVVAAGGGRVGPVTLRPPAPRMGLGEVFTALALSEALLNSHGLSAPTADALVAALRGGRIRDGRGRVRRLRGIFPLWRREAGWQRIPERLGIAPGPVLRALRAANQRAAATVPRTGGEAADGKEAAPVHLIESGIVTGRGKAVKRYARPRGGKKALGEGILSGSGKLLTVPSSEISSEGAGFRGPASPPREGSGFR